MALIKGYPEGSDITLVNTIYQRPTKDENGNRIPDKLTIVFRDNVTGEKKIETIKEPEYEYYVAKDEYVTPHNLMFIEKEKVEKVTVKYTQLLKSIAEHEGKLTEFYDNIRMGQPQANNKLNKNTDIFMSDLNFEDWTRFKFGQEYTNNTFKLNKAYFDIEVDYIGMKGEFVEPGECPINCASLLDERTKKVYTFALRNLQNPLIEQAEMQLAESNNLLNQLHDFVVDTVGGWKKATRFGLIDFQYEIMFFDSEIDLIAMIFAILRKLDPDFWMVWNASFDLPYILARIIELGYDPVQIICDPEMPQVAKYWVDTNNYNEFEQRCDFGTLGIKPVLADDMIHFASRRKGQGVFPSYKLDEIGRIVAGVRKLDYSHITTDLAMLPYLDFITFWFYNVIDVIVCYCIEQKTKDIDYVFNKALANNTRYHKVHRQTVYLTNRIANEFYKDGYIIGNNVNKWNEKPKEKFPGALVGNPKNNNDYSKRRINGRPVGIVDNLLDFDYKSLYPSIMGEDNIAPNTQIGKIILPVQVYKNENKYNYDKWTRAGEYIENFTSENHIEFCHRWFHLASYEEFLQDLFYLSQEGYLYNPMYIANEDGLLNSIVNMSHLNHIPGLLEGETTKGLYFYEHRTDLEDIIREASTKKRKECPLNMNNINMKDLDEAHFKLIDQDLKLLYSILRNLKMKKELPAYITWCGNEIFMIVDQAMLYHIMIDNMFQITSHCTWQELDRYINNGELFEVEIGKYNEELMKTYNAYYIQTTTINPFYISDTLKEDINEMGLKAADGMRKLNINPNCFLSIFNGIVAANKQDDVSIQLFLPQDTYWDGMFISKVFIRKKKAHFSYEQYFNSLLV